MALSDGETARRPAQDEPHRAVQVAGTAAQTAVYLTLLAGGDAAERGGGETVMTNERTGRV